MGWWSQGASGGIAEFTGGPATEEREQYWGDGPADILDNALAEIVAEFQRAWQRKPYVDELRRGLEFSLGAYEEDDDADSR